METWQKDGSTRRRRRVRIVAERAIARGRKAAESSGRTAAELPISRGRKSVRTTAEGPYEPRRASSHVRRTTWRPPHFVTHGLLHANPRPTTHMPVSCVSFRQVCKRAVFRFIPTALPSPVCPGRQPTMAGRPSALAAVLLWAAVLACLLATANAYYLPGVAARNYKVRPLSCIHPANASCLQQLNTCDSATARARRHGMSRRATRWSWR